MCGGNPAAIERMLAFGREVQHMSQVLRRDLGKNDHNKKILQVLTIHCMARTENGEIIYLCVR